MGKQGSIQLKPFFFLLNFILVGVSFEICLEKVNKKFIVLLFFLNEDWIIFFLNYFQEKDNQLKIEKNFFVFFYKKIIVKKNKALKFLSIF